jgi:hypothetical protein
MRFFILKDHPMVADTSTTERVPISNLPSAPSSRASKVFVWGTWGLLFLGSLAYIWEYSHNIPVYDDWILTVPIVTGQQRLTVSWLWEQHVQHRFPFQKLILHSWKKLGVTDLRAQLYFDVCALGILALVMIVVAKRLRGRTSYADAFFPLALLGMENFFWYLVPVVLAGILLVVMVGWGKQLTLGSAVVAGTCLVLLPLSGAVGMVCVPLPVLWLGYVGMRKWCSPLPSDVRCGSVILAFVLFGLLVVGLYFRNFVHNTTEQLPEFFVPSTDSVSNRLERALQVLALALGMGGAEWLWPLTGPTLAALLLISAVLLINTLWNRPPERSQALGLLLFIGFVACYALLLGWERPHCDRGYYGSYPALGMCCVYYVWELYASSRAASFVQLVLFTLVCAIVPLNTYKNLEEGIANHHRMEPAEQAMRAGAPPYKIITHHRKALGGEYRNTGDWLFPLVRSMRDAGCGNFRYMGEDPPFREVSVALTPTDVKGLTWDKVTARVSEKDSYLLFHVSEPRRVAGVRITYVHSSDISGGPAFQLFWKRNDQKEFPPDQSLSMPWLETGPEERTTGTIWIDETIDQLRIHPDDKPCTFKILRIGLIVPTEQ